MSMTIKTGRFGELKISHEELITFSQGLLGFPDCKKFFLVDSGDDTLILWLQSVDRPEVAFPVLEPKIFKPDYVARLSLGELKEIGLDTVNQSAVFTILTIPSDVTLMTANLRAPIVINLKMQTAKQVVLQDNDYGIKFAMFKELRTHLLTLEAQRKKSEDNVMTANTGCGAVALKNVPPTLTVKGLNS